LILKSFSRVVSFNLTFSKDSSRRRSILPFVFPLIYFLKWHLSTPDLTIIYHNNSYVKRKIALYARKLHKISKYSKTRFKGHWCVFMTFRHSGSLDLLKPSVRALKWI